MGQSPNRHTLEPQIKSSDDSVHCANPLRRSSDSSLLVEVLTDNLNSRCVDLLGNALCRPLGSHGIF